ncbi:MAG: glycosyltransferase family 4 protein, partial [Patescibacteria group bacterium]|nr:glycosyltransferase family 4 protein [Patescibacteria group bacterium]
IGGGFQYAEVLIAALTKYTGLKVYVLVGKNGEKVFTKLKKYPNFKILIYNGIPNSLYQLLKKEKIDLIHAPIQYFTNYFASIPMVATIHDLQHYHFPQYINREEKIYRDINYKKVAKKSERIIVGYNHVKKDIIKYFQISPQKIDICKIGYNFSHQINFSEWQTVKKKYQLPEKYLLYCANTWKHKNHLNLIRALKIVHKRYRLNIPLICTGQKYPDFFPTILKEIKKNNLDQDIKFLGYIPEEEKLLILNHATLVVIPTLYEGGCLPLMEAMQYEIPVICSNVTSLPEIINNKKYIFNPRSVEEIALKIKDMIQNKKFRMENIMNSRKQCDNLKWQNTIWQFVNCYEKTITKFQENKVLSLVKFQDWFNYIYKPHQKTAFIFLKKIAKNLVIT